jgi:hypothetical protein
VSGCNFPWLAAVKPEAELIKSLLIEWGIHQLSCPRDHKNLSV